MALYNGSKRNPENNYCEIRLEIPGNDLFVKKSNDGFETAVVEAVQALGKMILRNKEKKIDRKRKD